MVSLYVGWLAFLLPLPLPLPLSLPLSVCLNLTSYPLRQFAGNAVKRAADMLVNAAKNAAIFEEEETTVIINQRFVGGIAQELEAQEQILKIEKELEMARSKLGKIRQAKYRPEDDD